MIHFNQKGEPMNISNNYEQHVQSLKKLNMGEDFYAAREPFKEDFEAIYNKAKEENVTINNAKDFLNSLSKEELSTLQHYTLLVDDINVEGLSEEGAYNLLLHHYEKFDFNNDGLIQNGIANNGSLIPVNMPAQEKEALIASLNSMDDKERFMTMAMINPPTFHFEDGEFKTKFNEEFTNYDTIMQRIDRILNPLPGEKRSQEILNTIESFKDIFQEHYEELNTQEQAYTSNNHTQTMAQKAKLFS